MKLHIFRRTGATLAGLALCVLLVSPLVVAIHHHPPELVSHCHLCLLSSMALADTSEIHSLAPNLQEAALLHVESDHAVALNIAADCPARAPPCA